MIVITRNGKTSVYTGWREWLIWAAGFALCWMMLAAFVVLFVGAAITIGFMMLMAVPAAIVVALISGMTRR